MLIVGGQCFGMELGGGGGGGGGAQERGMALSSLIIV